VSTKAGELLRLAAPDAGAVVLRGTPGHLRGEVDVANDGSAPVMALPADTATVRPGSALRFGNPAGAIVPAGSARRVRLHASVDPTTAPGSYPVELDVGGQIVTATVEVIEQVSITLSPSSVVIDGVVGDAGSAAVLATNVGNVPLPISRVGPVPLDLDGARATLLDRVFGRETVVTTPTTVVNVHVHTEPESDDGEDDDEEVDPRPRVTGTLGAPVELQPGETLRLDFDFTIEGDVEAGRRYRALAPCYTSDLEIVVVPHQDVAAAPPPALRAGGRAAAEPAAKPASKRSAKKPAGGKRAAAARAPSKKKAAARARHPTATEE
jgi:hypothetical protein